MEEVYRDAIATHGASLITHIRLVDDYGDEITGGDPAYARQAVSWTTASDGLIRPTADREFNIPAGTNVAGWRGCNGADPEDPGDIDYGGADLEEASFSVQGIYRLLAAETAIKHDEAAVVVE